MKRAVTGLLGCVLVIAISSHCGGGRDAGRRRPTPQAAAEPTPDTTPVESLRTPAGLALKPEPTVTPAPAQTPTAPSAGPSSAATAGPK
jgi:hypothetical protein